MDLNHRMQESKSCALPLGDTPMFKNLAVGLAPTGIVVGFVYASTSNGLSLPT